MPRTATAVATKYTALGKGSARARTANSSEKKASVATATADMCEATNVSHKDFTFPQPGCAFSQVTSA